MPAQRVSVPLSSEGRRPKAFRKETALARRKECRRRQDLNAAGRIWD